MSNASILYVYTENSVFVPFAHEYETYGGDEFIQFFGQGAIVRFTVKSESFSAAVFKAFTIVKRVNFTGGTPYPLNDVAPKMVTKRYPCDPKLWPSG